MRNFKCRKIGFCFSLVLLALTLVQIPLAFAGDGNGEGQGGNWGKLPRSCGGRPCDKRPVKRYDPDQPQKKEDSGHILHKPKPQPQPQSHEDFMAPAAISK